MCLLGIFRDVRHLIDCGSPGKEEGETAKADAIGDTWGIPISWPGIAAPWDIQPMQPMQPISWHIPVKDEGDRNVAAGNGGIATTWRGIAAPWDVPVPWHIAAPDAV